MTKICLFLLLTVTLAFPVAAPAEIHAPDTVVVPNGPLRLKALLWKPAGRGPFPAVLFNHGSWPTSTSTGRPAEEIFAQAATLGPVFARHGFVFLFLFRRGAGLSIGQGASTADLMQTELAANGQEARNQIQLRLLETYELSDALAGLAYLRTLPDVDPRHVAVVGHSFGGSLTLLVAEQDKRLMAAQQVVGKRRQSCALDCSRRSVPRKCQSTLSMPKTTIQLLRVRHLRPKWLASASRTD
jgi:dienelactone hydrolase